MMNIDTTRLTHLEKSIVEFLSQYSQENTPPRIVDAARLCGCSVSQVSKTIKKTGYENYKQFIRHLYDDGRNHQENTAELERLQEYISEFDFSVLEDFTSLILAHNRIILFGYGPSQIAAEYFEYKLRIISQKLVMTARDESSVRSMVSPDSLLVILTTTGRFRSFADISTYARSHGCSVVVVSEEYNSSLMDASGRYLALSRHHQSEALKPYEKTRTVFFIFLEEVLRNIRNEETAQPQESSR